MGLELRVTCRDVPESPTISPTTCLVPCVRAEITEGFLQVLESVRGWGWIGVRSLLSGFFIVKKNSSLMRCPCAFRLCRLAKTVLVVFSFPKGSLY